MYASAPDPPACEGLVPRLMNGISILIMVGSMDDILAFDSILHPHIISENRQFNYRSRALLGACAYNSTGRKYAPISEMRLIMNMTFLE